MLDGNTNVVIEFKFMKSLVISSKHSYLKKIKCSGVNIFWLIDTVFQIQCTFKYQMRIYIITGVCNRFCTLINFCLTPKLITRSGD